ncbi:MAG: hypothetical protein HYT80_04945 [Euryarchaeota archaeon]|nr:hypothetical protein [Euryarchaeota archaeon]
MPKKAGRAELTRLLRGRELTEKKLLFVGWLNAQLPRGVEAVLVGGSLVQFYSGGAYESVDIDLVARRREEVRGVLLGAGFAGDVRGFEDAELELIVDLSTKGLRRTETVQYLTIEGWRVPVVSLEDAIVDRLLGAKAWRSDQDWEQAVLMFRTNEARVRLPALEEKALRNDVADFLRRLVESSDAAAKARARPTDER